MRSLYLLGLIFILSPLGYSAKANVLNPSVFIGEVVNGAVNGSPLTVTAGKVAQGLTSVETAFSSTITTTSTSDVVLTGMTTTPASGTYLVVFSSWFTHSNGNDTVTVSIYSGGVQSAGTIRTTVPFTGAVGGANNGMEAGTNGIVTVNGSQAIAIEWHTNSGTATAHNGTMDVVRLL